MLVTNAQVATQNRKSVCLFMVDASSGGAERVMINIANGIAGRAGVDVTIVLVNKTGAYLNQIDERVTVVGLGAKRAMSSILPLARFLRNHRPDVALSALNPTNLALIVAAKLSSRSTRLIVSDHANLTAAIHRSQNARAQIVPTFMRALYPLADEVIGVSMGVCDDLSEATGLPRSSISVQYNPVITDEVRTKSMEPCGHRWLQGLPGDPPVFLNVGRLADQKNQALLISAFIEVHKSRPCRLLILGEGPLHDDLQRQIEDAGLEHDIELHGFVDNPYPYLVAASAFVLSSRFEGLPTVLIEALFCGCPVISTDCPDGPSEILNDGEFGKLVEPDNVLALATAMEASLAQPSMSAADDAWLPYSSEVVLDQYAALFQMGQK